MACVRVIAIICIIFLGSGCSIHPLPEDFSRYNTIAIVQKIRCEARDSLFKKLEVWLQTAQTGNYDPNVALVRRKPSGSLDQATFDHVSPDIMYYVDYFQGTAIAYNFTFDMTENNNASVQIDLLNTISRGTLSATTKLGTDRSRQNIRTFTVSDTFLGLLSDLEDSYCADIRPGENYIYPITGTIGLDEMVDNYVDMALFGGLVGPEKSPKDQTSVDSLEFVTKLYGSLTPKLQLANVRNGITSAALGGDVVRLDKHKVIIAFALPAPKEVKAAKGAGIFITPEGTPTERRAQQKIEQFILRFEVNRPFVLGDPL